MRKALKGSFECCWRYRYRSFLIVPQIQYERKIPPTKKLCVPKLPFGRIQANSPFCILILASMMRHAMSRWLEHRKWSACDFGVLVGTFYCKDEAYTMRYFAARDDDPPPPSHTFLCIPHASIKSPK